MKKKMYAFLLSMCLLVGSVLMPNTVALADNIGREEVFEHSIENLPPYAEENGWGYFTNNNQVYITGYYGTDKKITIPNTLGGCEVTTIIGLIAYNETVEEVVIPEHVTSISPYWFCYASNLKTISLSSNATITGDTFKIDECKNLESILVDSNNPNLSSKDGVLFSADGTTLFCYPSAKAGNYVIPNTVKEICEYAFNNTTKLKDVTIPEGAGVYYNSFYQCEGITNYFVNGDNSSCCSENGVLFDKSKLLLVNFPSGRIGSYTVPSSVKTIKNNAFANSKLSEIILNDELTIIESQAFCNCVNLREINIPLGVTDIANGTFMDCVSLRSFNVHKNISRIYSSAFMGCDSLTEFKVDDANTEYSAYDGMLCDKEKTTLVRFPSGRGSEYTIPDNILAIDDEAFRESNNLKVINVPAHIDYFDIYECESLEAINVSPNNQNYTSLDGVLYNKDMTELCIVPTMKSGTFTIPSSVKSISSVAFMDCEGLEFLVIPKTVTKICGYDENENMNEISTIWLRPNVETILMIEKGSIADEYIQYIEQMSLIYCGIKANYIYCYGHNYEAKVTTEPTCTTKGVKTYTCKHSTCKHSYTEEIAAKGHTYNTTTIKATPTTNGSIVTKCNICQEVKSNITIYAAKNVKLDKVKYIYNGKVKTPKITVTDVNGKPLVYGTDYTLTYAIGRKNTGRYKVVVNFIGNYSGTVEKTFDIVPKKIKLKKVTGKKKAFTVTWKKQGKQITGYELKYSTTKKFTKKTTKTKVISNRNKTSFTKNKLKAKKTYYVKIRTYKTIKVNGKKVKLYSAWSSAKKVTIKKAVTRK